MKKPICAIIFDFDGVVADSEPLYESAEKRLFQHYGIRVPDEDWKDFKGVSPQAFFTTVQNRYNIPASVDTLRREGEACLLAEFKGRLGYVPGYEDFFTLIRPRFRVALVTSCARQVLDWIFTWTPIVNHFDVIITADDVPRHKPDPLPFSECCRRLNITPDEALVIEDSIHGVNAARAAGLRTIGFTRTLSPGDLAAADYLARDYTEIETLIRRITSDGRGSLIPIEM